MNFDEPELFNTEYFSSLWETFTYDLKKEVKVEKEKEKELEELMLAMHKHKREEKEQNKQKQKELRRNNIEKLITIFDEEIMLGIKTLKNK